MIIKQSQNWIGMTMTVSMINHKRRCLTMVFKKSTSISRNKREWEEEVVVFRQPSWTKMSLINTRKRIYLLDRFTKRSKECYSRTRMSKWMVKLIMRKWKESYHNGYKDQMLSSGSGKSSWTSCVNTRTTLMSTYMNRGLMRCARQTSSHWR